MGKKFIYSALGLMILCLVLPEISHAQLGGLVNKLKKKKKKTEETTKSTTSKVETPKAGSISNEDKAASKELAEGLIERLAHYDFLDDERYFEHYWEPNTAADLLKRANKELQSIVSGNLDQYYTTNKAAFEKYSKLGLTASFSSGGDLHKYWSADGKGTKALKAYKNMGPSLETALKSFWDRENKTTGGNPKTGLKQAADYFIEVAYENKDKDKPGSIKLMAELAKTFDLVKQVTPANSPLQSEMTSLQNDTKAALKDLGGEYLTNLYVSDFHKANAGKIFFAKTPITPKTANASSFTSDFTVSDNIYAIAYFDATLSDLKIIQEQNDGYNESTKTYNKKSVFNKYAQISFGGANTMMQFVAGDWGAMGKQGYLVFSIKPSLDKADNQGAIEGFAKTISTKSPRTHTLPVKFAFRGATAQGDLKINLAGMNADQIKADAQKAVEKAKTELERAKVLSRGLPGDFMNAKLFNHKFPHVTMAQVKQLATTRYASRMSKIDAIVVQDGHYDRTQWEVKVNALGTPINRKGPGYFIAFTGKDGKCYHDFFQIYQDYIGGGYSATKTAGYSNAGKATAIEYNCAKKKFAK